MGLEICSRCNKFIGQYETGCVYDGKVVCEKCDSKLRGIPFVPQKIETLVPVVTDNNVPPKKFIAKPHCPLCGYEMELRSVRKTFPGVVKFSGLMIILLSLTFVITALASLDDGGNVGIGVIMLIFGGLLFIIGLYLLIDCEHVKYFYCDSCKHTIPRGPQPIQDRQLNNTKHIKPDENRPVDARYDFI